METDIRMKHRKVIFIGGTSYSGSTLLDMILANSPSGFSCGEVCALFHPYRKHHINFECGCGNPQCEIWPTILKEGPQNMYNTIFEMFPETSFIVDSSKDPLWIYDRTMELAASDIAVKNVLIWKTPEEFFVSMEKRKRAKGWNRAWCNYHKLYFRLVRDWCSVTYRKLVTSAGTLEKLCDEVGISCFDGKSNYWNKVHHTVFGNTSAKIHLYQQGSNRFQQCQQELGEHESLEKLRSEKEHAYRTLYYRPGSSRVVVPRVNGRMREIEHILIAREIESSSSSGNETEVSLVIAKLRASRFIYLINRLMRLLRTVSLKARLGHS